MEANPGTVEAGRFAGYQAAGINRISIGVQSFGNDKLITGVFMALMKRNAPLSWPLILI